MGGGHPAVVCSLAGLGGSSKGLSRELEGTLGGVGGLNQKDGLREDLGEVDWNVKEDEGTPRLLDNGDTSWGKLYSEIPPLSSASLLFLQAEFQDCCCKS